ncbi:MAG: sulfatase-like hydrolase/transferase, partial [Solirubrobacterales bacterium]
PGWDHWFAHLHAHGDYYDYTVSHNGKGRRFRERNRAYATRVINRKAERWVKRLAKRRRPLYLQIEHVAPHTQVGRRSKEYWPPCTRAPMPDPQEQDRKRLRGPFPRPPSFNEKNVKDKPKLARTPGSLPRIGAEDRKKIRQRFRCAVTALRGVDRGVKILYEALKGHGEWDDTVVIFTSDNGYLHGEHRIPRGKLFPYEPVLHMPLIIRVPKKFLDGNQRVGSISKPVANIDIAPTILELAGADSCEGDKCRVMDGRSLLDLLKGDESAWPADRALVVERRTRCRIRGLRASRHQLIVHKAKWRSGRCIINRSRAGELYDLDNDPFQLRNRYRAPRETPDGRLRREMEERLAKLQDCAGIEGRDPVPASGVYCE